MAKRKSAKSARRHEPKLSDVKSKAIALAALYITESILLELHSSEVLTSKQIRGLLQDAATTLLNAKGGKNSFTAASKIVDSMSRQYESRL